MGLRKRRNPGQRIRGRYAAEFQLSPSVWGAARVAAYVRSVAFGVPVDVNATATRARTAAGVGAAATRRRLRIPAIVCVRSSMQPRILDFVCVLGGSHLSLLPFARLP